MCNILNLFDVFLNQEKRNILLINCQNENSNTNIKKKKFKDRHF